MSQRFLNSRRPGVLDRGHNSRRAHQRHDGRRDGADRRLNAGCSPGRAYRGNHRADTASRRPGRYARSASWRARFPRFP